MLEVGKISKKFGGVAALQEVSFAVPQGAIWGLAGANGAGKTTLLRVLSGAEECDSGFVRWNGRDLLDDTRQLRRRVALMPDSLPDAGDITVAEYLDFYRRAFCRDADAVRRAAEVCGILPEWEKKFFPELSRGMKQRVSLARMLIAEPEVFLLDEPGEGLDPRGRSELRDILHRLAGEGHTVLVSSHILAELQEFVSGVVILDAGRVVEGGRLDELLPRYEVRTLEGLYLHLTAEEGAR
ncbi:MAG: ABC transporter ATP-binding protein [Victivallaceae bacterium]|nr:ABC transporter ATP-binding protein [Victivallaceae bacterium]